MSARGPRHQWRRARTKGLRLTWDDEIVLRDLSMKAALAFENDLCDGLFCGVRYRKCSISHAQLRRKLAGNQSSWRRPALGWLVAAAAMALIVGGVVLANSGSPARPAAARRGSTAR